MTRRIAAYGLALGAIGLAAVAMAVGPAGAQEKKDAENRTTAQDYGVIVTEEERRAAGPLAFGAFVYSQRCLVCHAPTAAEGRTDFGPHLEGIIGRKAAATGWSQHTAALTGSDMVWTEEAMNTLLRDPQEALPGMQMDVVIRFRRSRKALIQYLKTL